MESKPDRDLILIVDDDEIERELIKAALAGTGCEIIEGHNGLEGLELTAARRPDLIIMDVMMPVLDGYLACRALRADDRNRHLPVLMTTALNDTASIEKAFEAGATSFTTKPLNHSLLPYQVRYLIRGGRLELEMMQARQRAESAYIAKSRFLAEAVEKVL